MRKHLIATLLSAGTASALVLALGAAASLARPDAAAAGTRASGLVAKWRYRQKSRASLLVA